MSKDEPWQPGEATRRLNELARSRSLEISYKLHAKERLAERNLFVTDVLHALKYGFVYKSAEAATRPDMYKYLIQCRTPNSGSREVGVVVIPAPSGCRVKIVTVMWIDEK